MLNMQQLITSLKVGVVMNTFQMACLQVAIATSPLFYCSLVVQLLSTSVSYLSMHCLQQKVLPTVSD